MIVCGPLSQVTASLTRRFPPIRTFYELMCPVFEFVIPYVIVLGPFSQKISPDTHILQTHVSTVQSLNSWSHMIVSGP